MAALDLKLWFGGMCFLMCMISHHQSLLKHAEVDVDRAAGVEYSYVRCLKSDPGKPCSSENFGPARISNRRGGVGIIFRHRFGRA